MILFCLQISSGRVLLRDIDEWVFERIGEPQKTLKKPQNPFNYIGLKWGEIELKLIFEKKVRVEIINALAKRYLFALWPNRVTHFLLWFVPRLRLPDYPLTLGVCIWMQNQAIYNTFISTTARWVFSYSFISSALANADRSLTYFCNFVLLETCVPELYWIDLKPTLDEKVTSYGGDI